MFQCILLSFSRNKLYAKPLVFNVISLYIYVHIVKEKLNFYVGIFAAVRIYCEMYSRSPSLKSRQNLLLLQVSLTGLERFGDLCLEFLKRAIERRYPEDRDDQNQSQQDQGTWLNSNTKAGLSITPSFVK